MGWESDREPLDYLERRLRYYNRKLRKFKRTQKEDADQWTINYFGGKRAYHKAVAATIKKTELRISQYQEAIKKLKIP